MRIYFSNEPDFTTSDWYHDIILGSSEYNVGKASQGGADYFRLEEVPSACKIYLRSQASVGDTNGVEIYTTHFNTRTGVIEYASLLMHPCRAFTPGVTKLREDFHYIELKNRIFYVWVTLDS